jgi:hypothetical protein
LLSLTVMRVKQVFHLFMMLSVACVFVSVVVFHPSRCELTVVRFGGVV